MTTPLFSQSISQATGSGASSSTTCPTRFQTSLAAGSAQTQVRWLSTGWVTPSQSSWTSKLLMVPSTGTCRWSTMLLQALSFPFTRASALFISTKATTSTHFPMSTKLSLWTIRFNLPEFWTRRTRWSIGASNSVSSLWLKSLTTSGAEKNQNSSPPTQPTHRYSTSQADTKEKLLSCSSLRNKAICSGGRVSTSWPTYSQLLKFLATQFSMAVATMMSMMLSELLSQQQLTQLASLKWITMALLSGWWLLVARTLFLQLLIRTAVSVSLSITQIQAPSPRFFR